MSRSRALGKWVKLLAIVSLVFITATFISIKVMERGKRGQAFEIETFKVHFWGWVVHYDPKSKESYFKNHEKFTWVSPTWYIVNEEGRVVEIYYDEELVRRSREWNIKVIPLIANKDFDPAIVHMILSDENLRKNVIESIIRIVLERGYDGINIDFEGIPAEDRELLNKFVLELSFELHKYDRILTIDVPAKTRDVKTGWAGAFDYAFLGRYCDLVIIMIYDYHWSGSEPGPISPLGWFKDVLRYAKTVIPKEKIVAGIPFYGYDWIIGGRGKGVTYDGAINIAKKYGATIVFSEEEGEAYFKYSKNGEQHEVWFNTAESTRLRLSVAISMGIKKIAAWRIGQEDPKTWDLIEKP
ncbi:MAG: hypothetical protein DRZ82_02155 [Thermoprotei archaeon]|nr:MAG: hypothetical protein DRZ82_02155 [Thermoprotei archaeon]